MTFLGRKKKRDKKIQIKFNFFLYKISFNRNWVRKKSHEFKHQHKTTSISCQICVTLIKNIHGINSLDWLVMGDEMTEFAWSVAHTTSHCLLGQAVVVFFGCAFVRNFISFSNYMV